MLGVDGSLSLADIAFMDTPGSTARKVKAAIWVYIWSSQNGSEMFGMAMEPSADEMRAALAEAIERGEV